MILVAWGHHGVFEPTTIRRDLGLWIFGDNFGFVHRQADGPKVTFMHADGTRGAFGQRREP